MLLDNYRALQGALFPDIDVGILNRDGVYISTRMYSLLREVVYTSIMIGTSDEPVDRSQYDLVEPVTDGIVESNKSMFYEDGTTKLKTFYRFSSVITNNSSSAITIKELGLYNSASNVLLIREVVSPYVLEPGESVLLSISIE